MCEKNRCLWIPVGTALALTLICSMQASATIIPLSATLDGAQANAGAGSGSPGTGSASMTFDTDTNLFSWDISWAGLLGTETVMHFHGAALPNQNAGVQVDFGSISGTTSPSIGATNISASQAADLLDSLWYINIHTNRDPGGEIRGQVIPEPTTSVLLIAGALGSMTCIWRRRRS